jgi:hypothetical protein
LKKGQNVDSIKGIHYLGLGNFNIDFLVFCHRLNIMGQKCLKIEKDQNATENY